MFRYRDLPTHTTDVLDLTSLTVDEFAALVPPFEGAFLDYMADWTLHGRHRQARRYTTDKNCPLPTPEDRLWCILVYLKQNPHNCCMGACSGCASPRPHNGFMSYCPRCAMPCAPWGMRPLVGWRPCTRAWRWKDHPCRWPHHARKRSEPPHRQ